MNQPHTTRHRITIFALLLLAALLPLNPAAAQANIDCTGTIEPPRRLAIECAPGFATGKDRITIYSQRDLDPARPWQE
ncbi:MAG: hypothetical protein JOZ51_13990, partial [Chloroflexi bacterium]|nr:hypothetical protein [Chloroflexota bacterium]